MTCTVGGTISGYCATGRTNSAPSPISVMKTLTTVARIGRSMKRMGETHGDVLSLPWGLSGLPGLSESLSAFSAIVPATGVTFAPGLTRTRPSMTTVSVGARPPRITRSPRCRPPISTVFGTIVPSAPTVITTWRD